MKISVLASAIAGSWFVAQGALAAGGDFSLDFTAAEPSSYDHATGGGAYNDRTIGKDVVESLEGGDFACGDTVTFLTQITVDAGAVGSQSLAIGFEFTAHSTGQQGVALLDNGPGQDAIVNQSLIDSGTADDGGSTAVVGPAPEALIGTAFVKPAKFVRTVTVNDLEAGETVVLRTDVRIGCNGQSPTGNMQARLFTVDGGDQTIPFKHVGDIKPPPK